MPADLEAFVLIGGRSTRFGSDKALFEFQGESLAARAVSTIETAIPGVVVTFVAASEEQFGIKVNGLPRPVIFDLKQGFGAWSGLDAALSHSTSEWTFVMACDLPSVTPEFVRRLVSDTADGVDAVVPRQKDGRLQPLCALYRTSAARETVKRQLRSGHVPALSSIFDILRTAVVKTAEEAVDLLKNVNQPEDLI